MEANSNIIAPVRSDNVYPATNYPSRSSHNRDKPMIEGLYWIMLSGMYNPLALREWVSGKRLKALAEKKVEIAMTLLCKNVNASICSLLYLCIYNVHLFIHLLISDFLDMPHISSTK